MLHPPPGILPTSFAPPPVAGLPDSQLALLAAAALLATGFFAVLRAALLHSVPGRVLVRASAKRRRERLGPLLERAEALATSASVCEISCQIVFVVLTISLTAGLAWHPVVLAVLISAPLLVFASEVFPTALRGDPSDRLLVRVLPLFDSLQKPLGALAFAMEILKSGLVRLLRLPPAPRSARRVVEDLRVVFEDAEFEGELDQTERELIENVVDAHEVDITEVMTPRTEIEAVPLEAGIDEVMQTIARTGHTRIPVYGRDLDAIVGLVYAQDVLRVIAAGSAETASLRELARPVSFVPETKHVSELLVEFRRDKQKTAVVVDEYGGTAGLITLGDIVAEIVGEMRKELGKDAPAAVRELEPGLWHVQANTRISEVNEELDLDLPEEEDFDTLGGYLLSEFGRFPKPGETHRVDGWEFRIVEASDRRILTVRTRRLTPRELAG